MKHRQSDQSLERVRTTKVLKDQRVLSNEIVMRKFGEFGQSCGPAREEKNCDCAPACGFVVESHPGCLAMGEEVTPGQVALYRYAWTHVKRSERRSIQHEDA